MMLLRVATTMVSTIAPLESLVGRGPSLVVDLGSHQPCCVVGEDAGHAGITKYVGELVGLIASALLNGLTSGLKDLSI